MRKSKFTESQIVSIPKQQEAGAKVADLCREADISVATFHKWKAKYGGMDAAQLMRLRTSRADRTHPAKATPAFAHAAHQSAHPQKVIAHQKWEGQFASRHAR